MMAKKLYAGLLSMCFSVILNLNAYATVDIKYVPISENAYINNLRRGDIDEPTMKSLIIQGCNCGYAVIAYDYFLNRVEENPHSARLQLFLSWAAERYSWFIQIGHSAVKRGSTQDMRIQEVGMKAITSAYKLLPTSAVIVCSYGSSLWEDGRLNGNSEEMDKALTLLRRSVDMGSSLSITHYALGRALVERDFGGKASKEAISELTSAVKLDPNESSGHDLLADAYEMNGDQVAAKREMTIALSLRNGVPITVEMTAVEPGSGWQGNIQTAK
jgi:hypothetical protein